MTGKCTAEAPEQTTHRIAPDRSEPSSAPSFDGGHQSDLELHRILGNRRVTRLIEANTLRRQPLADPEPYQIEGGKYTPQEKKHAAEDKSGLILTASVIGKQEQKLEGRAPAPFSVDKEWMRFEGGRLGEFVSDYNDFTQYFGEVLLGIGRLRDLISAGAPEYPDGMTATQKRALRPTDDTASSVTKKTTYRDWREEQDRYATAHSADGRGLPGGLVFEVARTSREFDLSRQAYWQAKGRLSRTIASAKGLSKPDLDVLEVKLGDIAALASPWSAIATGVDKVLEARKKRQEYDKKMKEFGSAIKTAGDAVRDEFEAFKGASATYWTRLAEHQKAIAERDHARIESRQRAALVGQAIADPGETRSPVLAEVRMPLLVADAWHALAVIGPPTRDKLVEVLAGRAVVEKASKKDLGWRDDDMEIKDITRIRLAWQRAHSWQGVLNKDDVDNWVYLDKLWQETLTKFNV